MKQPQVSVIVPIYNLENTLRRCVDSVLSQTFPEFEVLLVDDGSTDTSGSIADAYLADSRVRVFHKQNGGVSSARNFGIDRMQGTYAAFVDADDWIEPNTLETALRYCKNSDICSFGRFLEGIGAKSEWSPASFPERISGEEAIRRLIVENSIRHVVWDKLYRSTLFDGIRFPEGFNYEDGRTTYRLFQKAETVTLIPDVLYHYIKQEGSITYTETIRNLLDIWSCYYELYHVFSQKGEEYRDARMLLCFQSIYIVWGSLWKASSSERFRERDRIEEIISFARLHRKEASRLRLNRRIAVLAAATGKRWSQFPVYLIRSLLQKRR